MTARKTTGYRHMTPAERKECVRLYQTGATLDSLAEFYGRAHNTIVRLVRRCGVKRGDAFRVNWKRATERRIPTG